jgi:hypothetical protein
LLVAHEDKIREGQTIEYIGCGDSSLLHFLADRIDDSEPFDVDDAAVIAAHLVGNAKKYIDGCGGPTQIVTLKDGRITFWEESKVQNMETVILETDGDSGRCRSVFRGMPITDSGSMAITRSDN